MKNDLKRVLSTITLFSLAIFISCATEPTKATTDSHQGFSRKMGYNDYFKVVINKMDRGEYKPLMRIIGDSGLYDAVYFDVEIQNIHKNKDMIAYSAVFRLMTDGGTHIDCCAIGWEGAFDGDIGVTKSNILEPGTKKTGAIGFPLKKTSNPTKLIFDPSLLDIPGEKIIFDLR